jgi:hypothetical protein
MMLLPLVLMLLGFTAEMLVNAAHAAYVGAAWVHTWTAEMAEQNRSAKRDRVSESLSER